MATQIGVTADVMPRSGTLDRRIGGGLSAAPVVGLTPEYGKVLTWQYAFTDVEYPVGNGTIVVPFVLDLFEVNGSIGAGTLSAENTLMVLRSAGGWYWSIDMTAVNCNSFRVQFSALSFDETLVPPTTFAPHDTVNKRSFSGVYSQDEPTTMLPAMTVDFLEDTPAQVSVELRAWQ